MPWTPGASGNPKGRPPKSRALTAILEQAGGQGVPTGQLNKAGKPIMVSRKKLLADMLWQAAAHGQVNVLSSDGKTLTTMTLEGDDWLSVVKFLFTQIDGPPKVSLLDVPEDVTTEIRFVKTEGRPASTITGNLPSDEEPHP